MTGTDRASFTRVDIPVESQPNWEKRYPGRLRFELDALESAGIELEVDPEALKNRQLALIFDWPLKSGSVLRLKAVFPDSFPHLRPSVYLLSGLDPVPVRHCSPMEGNLCLLGRDSSQWMPSWTLYKLLSNQLEHSVHATGEEDPQGEPAEYWWNFLNRSGSFCLIDSAWDLGNARKGMLLLRYVRDGVKSENHGSGTIRMPVIRAYVAEIHDTSDKVIHSWDAPLPPELSNTKYKMLIPWVRSDKIILPEREMGKQIEKIREEFTWLKRSKPLTFQSGLDISLCAVVHSSELSFGQLGVGWIMFLAFGHPQAFAPITAHKKRRKPIRIAPIPI
ncbi:MAG: hypothetical protein IH899_10450, partial [Planctomycetes bacterium]|nr:hypothetical protein [Planctomycetota bacterium]